jgi:50S ribosomal subunit-associated GTPase HflX
MSDVTLLPCVAQKELALYTEVLTKVPAVVIANKIDIVHGSQDQLMELRAATSLPVVAVSALQGDGIQRLKRILRELSPTEM